MNTHIDTLTAWFDNGETGTFTPGDVIISKNDDEYVITTINHSGTINPGEPDRILHRAPKPEPAWHNAVAVLANHRDYEDEPCTVWTRESDPEGHDWSDAHTTMAAPHHLTNVTPLFEAKVTDEMVLRALQARSTRFGNDPAKRLDNYAPLTVESMRAGLQAALNLDPA